MLILKIILYSGPDSTTTSVCIGMVKLIDTFIYMADDCDNKHNFICDKSKFLESFTKK